MTNSQTLKACHFASVRLYLPLRTRGRSSLTSDREDVCRFPPPTGRRNTVMTQFVICQLEPEQSGIA